MKTRIHHAAIRISDLEWHLDFFKRVFGMTLERTQGEKPNRQVWLFEGIQLIETEDCEAFTDNGLCDHISLGVDGDPEEVAREAIAIGCSPVDGKGAHWFAFPSGIRMELKPYR